MNIFEIRDLKFSYENQKPLLDIDSLDIKKGKITILSGPNGSGKTTLLKLLSGFLKPVSGSIGFNGETAKRSFLPQDPYLLKRSIRSNIEYGLRLKKKRSKAFIVDEALEMVGFDPSEYSKRKWYELSGGERKRTALAARLVLEPEVLILDEPSESIDYMSRYHLTRAVKNIASNGRSSIIISSHDRSWSGEIGEEFNFIIGGKAFSGFFLNIITSKWSEKGGNLSLEYSPYYNLEAFKPDTTDSLAVIKPESIKISKNSCLIDDNEKNYFRGKVRSCGIAMDGKIIYSVISGDMRISVISENCFINPGDEVFLKLDKEDFLWI